MNAHTRRQIAALLCGIAATLVALAVATYLRERACVEAGGRWLATRQCELVGGTGGTGDVRAYALGALAGLLALVVLWRTFTFFVMRASRRGA